MAPVVAFNALAASAFDKLAPDAIASINSDLFILILSNKSLLNKKDKAKEVNFYTFSGGKNQKKPSASDAVSEIHCTIKIKLFENNYKIIL
jgi:hypothetical protein